MGRLRGSTDLPGRPDLSPRALDRQPKPGGHPIGLGDQWGWLWRGLVHPAHHPRSVQRHPSRLERQQPAFFGRARSGPAVFRACAGHHGHGHRQNQLPPFHLEKLDLHAQRQSGQLAALSQRCGRLDRPCALPTPRRHHRQRSLVFGGAEQWLGARPRWRDGENLARCLAHHGSTPCR